MDGVRAHVADGRGQGPGDFALDVEVPVQSIVGLRVLIGGVGLETRGAENNAGQQAAR